MSEYYKCCGCPKFENNEHCDDTIIFCEHELAEHDSKIINKFAEELKSRLGDAIYPKDFESMRNLIDDVARDVNAR